MNQTEIAWAAGFFDGEGNTTSVRKSHALQVTISQVDRSNLFRFRAAVGGRGALSGPYAPRGVSRKPLSFYRAYADKAHEVLTLLWPYLGQAKTDQALRALIHYVHRPLSNQTLSALGVCARGHKLAEVGVYPNPTRGNECRACRASRRVAPLQPIERPTAIELRYGIREYAPAALATRAS